MIQEKIDYTGSAFFSETFSKPRTRNTNVSRYFEGILKHASD